VEKLEKLFILNNSFLTNAQKEVKFATNLRYFTERGRRSLMKLRLDFIVQALPNSTIIQRGIERDTDLTFSIDTRTLTRGDIFVAITGNRVDGHDFIENACKLGASGIIIAHGKKECLKKIPATLLNNLTIIAVNDTRDALIAVAMAWRKEYRGKVIGITGSVGKTSTKQILSTILTVHNVPHMVSAGNQNTALGVSLTLLKVREEHAVLLVEMGINKRGEMVRLAEIAQPTAAVVTVIGHSHMEGLGSLVDIAGEKRDIFKFFKEDSIGIINGDQPFLAGVAYHHPVIKFGTKTTNQVQARKIVVGADQTVFIMKLYGQKHKVVLPTTHRGAVFNVLAASAAAYLLGIPADAILQAIQMPLFVPGRFEKRALPSGKGFIINDCYNASPESMKAALIAFQQVATSAQKIAVLGDMLELGVNSPFWHRQLGRLLRKAPGVKHVILVGSLVEWTKKTVPVSVKVDHVHTWQEAVVRVRELAKQESAILVKGSQGMGLINLVNEVAQTA
jgi:UDP-N-acetylmuramoyl-tripeptide--D-alanyl-D-alanine ligase